MPKTRLSKRAHQVLAYVFGRRKDEVFLKLKALLEPFGITRYYTDYYGTYTRHINAAEYRPGKRYTQKIERKHLRRRPNHRNTSGFAPHLL